MKLFKKAILVIHGFSGSLADNEMLVNQLETNNSFDVYAWTLPAHEKYVINKVKYHDWVESVDKQMTFLLSHGYRKIYVVGHSMGGVLATYLGARYKQIKKIVLLSPAFNYLSFNQYKQDIKDFSIIKDEYSSYGNFFHKMMKIPFPTMLQFTKLVKEYRDYIKDIKQEVLVLHGTKDELVPYDTIDYIKENIGSKNTFYTTINNGRHVLLRGEKKEELIKYIEAFLIGGRKWKQMKKSEF